MAILGRGIRVSVQDEIETPGDRAREEMRQGLQRTIENEMALRPAAIALARSDYATVRSSGCVSGRLVRSRQVRTSGSPFVTSTTCS
jgi:hypothetical protein